VSEKKGALWAHATCSLFRNIPIQNVLLKYGLGFKVGSPSMGYSRIVLRGNIREWWKKGMIMWKHVQCREKVEIGVSCAPTKSHHNISARHLKTTLTLDLLPHLPNGSKNSMPMLLNNAYY